MHWITFSSNRRSVSWEDPPDPFPWPAFSGFANVIKERRMGALCLSRSSIKRVSFLIMRPICTTSSPSIRCFNSNSIRSNIIRRYPRIDWIDLVVLSSLKSWFEMQIIIIWEAFLLLGIIMIALKAEFSIISSSICSHWFVRILKAKVFLMSKFLVLRWRQWSEEASLSSPLCLSSWSLTVESRYSIIITEVSGSFLVLDVCRLEGNLLFLNILYIKFSSSYLKLARYIRPNLSFCIGFVLPLSNLSHLSRIWFSSTEMSTSLSYLSLADGISIDFALPSQEPCLLSICKFDFIANLGDATIEHISASV